MMKRNRTASLVLALLAMVLLHTVATGGGAKVSSYKLSAEAQLYATAGDTNYVGGYCRARYDLKGVVTNQSFFIRLEQLISSTNYIVSVRLRGDTNYVDAATITTDNNGYANVTFDPKYTGMPTNKKQSLPAAMDPVNDILLVLTTLQDLTVASTQAVLLADFHFPDKVNYKVNDALVNTGVETNANGDLVIRSYFQSVRSTVGKSNVVTQIIDQNRLTISAVDLMPLTAYFIAFNGTISTNITTDTLGALELRMINRVGNLALPPQPPDGSRRIEEYRFIDILDLNTNSVLNVILP